MSQYTTGDLAKTCNVSVRTVQFYDSKGLLKPSELTDGGRRLYYEEDVKKLNMICLLKSLGFSLDTIKGILESNKPDRILMLLLEEQERQIDTEINTMQEQIKAIRVVKENIRNEERISVNSISDIERIMAEKKELKRTYTAMTIIAVIMAIIEVSTVVLWITKGIWQPFAAGMLVVIILSIILVKIYYKNTAYICPECNNKFKPALGTFMFAKHTPKTRKLKCSECGKTNFCVETYAD